MSRHWIEDNLEDTECVLCWISERHFLNHGGTPIQFHRIDKTLMLLVDAMIKRGRSGVLVYPVNRPEVAISLCAEALYFLMQNSSRNKVLLISRNVAVKDIYRGLKTNYLDLNTNFPLGIVRIDGTVKPQLKTLDSQAAQTNCKFLYTSSPDVLPPQSIMDSVGCIFIDVADLEPPVVEQLILWAQESKVKPIIFLETNPYSESFPVFSLNGLPTWGWDSESLRRDFSEDMDTLKKDPARYSTPLTRSAYQLQNLVGGVTRRILEVDEGSIPGLLNDSLRLYFDMRKIASESKDSVLSDACATFLSCKYAFERMLAPLQDTEEACKKSYMSKSLERRIEDLESWRTVISRHSSSYTSFWGRTYGLAKLLYSKFAEEGNPKYATVKKLLSESFHRNERILVVCHSESYANALTAALCRDLSASKEELSSRGVDVISASKSNLDKVYDTCIVFGQMNFRFNWLMRMSYAKEIIFLVYPSEKALLKYKFEKEEGRFADRFGRKANIEFLKNILGRRKLESLPPSASRRKEDLFALKLEGTQAAVEKKIKRLSKAIEEDEEASAKQDLQQIEDEAEESEPRIATVSASGYRIDFDDKTHIFFRPNKMLPIFSSGKLEYTTPDKIKPGQHLVFIRAFYGNMLSQRVHAELFSSRRAKKLEHYANAWNDAIRRGMMDNQDSPKNFYAKLKEAAEKEGLDVPKFGIVKKWIWGLSIGPRNFEFIKVVGEVYDDQFLIRNYKKIANAMEGMRELNRRVLKEFDDTIVRGGVRYLAGDDEDAIVDGDLGLTVRDFANTVSLKRINSISKKGRIRKSKLGQIRRWD